MSPALSTSARKIRREEDVVVPQHLPLGDLDVVVDVRAARTSTTARTSASSSGTRASPYRRIGPVAQRPGDRGAEGDPGVLDRMVPVHVEIALRLHREIEQPMPRERLLWSKKPMPVFTRASPRPSRPTRTRDRSPWSCDGSPPLARSPRLPAEDPRQPVEHRVHVLLRADRDPQALRQLDGAGDVSHQDAVLLVQPAEHLAGRARQRISTKLAAVENVDPRESRRGREGIGRGSRRSPGSARRAARRCRARLRRRPA